VSLSFAVAMRHRAVSLHVHIMQRPAPGDSLAISKFFLVSFVSLESAQSWVRRARIVVDRMAFPRQSWGQRASLARYAVRSLPEDANVNWKIRYTSPHASTAMWHDNS